jgi:hypothetical protein
MWHVNFDESTRDDLDRLRDELVALEDSTGATHLLAWRDALEHSDYAQADFIELLGAELSTEPPFVLNEAEVLDPGEPCPRCGSQDILDSVQTAPFVIDEPRLDGPAADGRRPDAGRWDVVTMPNGHKLVSKRLVAVLEENEVRGYELADVIDARTGEPSKRMFQITAAKAVLTVCEEHTRSDGQPLCQECGAAVTGVEGFLYVRADEVGDDEVISRHPGRGAMLYLSRRAFALIEDLDGVVRNAILMVCRH